MEGAKLAISFCFKGRQTNHGGFASKQGCEEGCRVRRIWGIA